MSFNKVNRTLVSLAKPPKQAGCVLFEGGLVPPSTSNVFKFFNDQCQRSWQSHCDVFLSLCLVHATGAPSNYEFFYGFIIIALKQWQNEPSANYDEVHLLMLKNNITTGISPYKKE